MSMTIWLGRLSVVIGVTGRGYNHANPTWCGFSYGSWWPRVGWNGGSRNRGEVVDIRWYFLCFHGSFTWWTARLGNWCWGVRHMNKGI